MATFTQLTARLKTFLMDWLLLLVLAQEEGLVVKSWVILTHVHYGVIVQMQRGVRVGAAFVLCTGSTIRHIRTESNLYAD